MTGDFQGGRRVEAGRRVTLLRRMVALAGPAAGRTLKSFDVNNVNLYKRCMASGSLVSIDELAESINRWCVEHGITPANGQAGERITERNIRFYRTRGLLDAPGSESGEHKRGFSDKHAAQLRAIRLLQARPLPLEEIQAQIQGRSLEELQELERQELRKINGAAATIMGGAPQENWQVTVVGGEYLLVSRRGRAISEEQRRQVAAILGVVAVAGG